MKLESLELGEALELLIDNRGKNPPYQDQGIPVVSGMSVRQGRMDLSTAKFASIETWKKWMPSPTRAGDVLLTSEAPLGRTALIRTEEPLVIGQRIFCLRGREGMLDSRFLYYALQTETVQADLQSRATGTTVLGIRQPELRKVRIPAPSYTEQLRIADVLGGLDEKIAANNRVIDAAESLMIALALTATGWTEVSTIAKQSTTALPPNRFDEVTSHFSLPSFDESGIPSATPAGAIKSNKFLLSEPCVLMSKLNPRIPRIWDVNSLPEHMAIASTEFVVLIPDEMESSVLWAALRDPHVSRDITAKVAGTSGSHQRVKPSEILALRVRDPRTLGSSTQKSIASIGSSCHARRIESLHLAMTRDQLIPLLMSGKARIIGAGKSVEGV